MSLDIINGSDKIAKFLNITLPAGSEAVEKVYPVQATEYYLKLIADKSGSDPIWKQCMPDQAELGSGDVSEDPLFEEQQMPVPRLIRRFKDRAVLLTTGKCAVRCRFCFRKRYWATGNDLPNISDTEIETVIRFLLRNADIQEVLISGGDPLMLGNELLLNIIQRLKTIPHIGIIRIGTRMPVVLPSRIDSTLIDSLRQYSSGLWIMTHFNHSCEITDESISACRKFIDAGIPVLNQTVLLRGINDDSIILEKLFRNLIKINVKPHYLFHVDPVRGVGHFSTGIAAGLQILRNFRSELSSLAVPTFAIDLPEGGGKVALQPNYRSECGTGCYYSILNDRVIQYPDE
jgi:lysine 2,3-aminomutase